MPTSYGPIHPSVPHMLHGADYNPEQWIDVPGVWDEDMRLMKLAGCNVMNVGIFSWARYEPEEGRYEFDWMDRVLDMLERNGVKAVLATPSAAKPPWLAVRYPETRIVLPDGTRQPHCGRHNHCPTSPIYREKITALNTRLAERYKDHPALVVWHVSNEYSGGGCHCDLCFAAFRAWLKERYGTIDALNRAWWSTFWSHRYGDWEEIVHIDTALPGMALDWRRFTTHQQVDFFKAESRPLRDVTPEVPITVNMMGFYEGLDYWRFAPHVDVISWDSYPAWHSTGDDAKVGAWTALSHDLNRSLKGGKPFMLMESTPSNQNWMPICRKKRPGMHLLSSVQAVAHGSDTVQYFQWRKGRGGSEKHHGAVVDHVGHEHTRVFRDVRQVGDALAKLGDVVGTSVEPEVAIVCDWENRWAVDLASGPHNKRKMQLQRVEAHYREFWRRGIPVDVVNEESDLSRYKLVVAPMLLQVRKGVGERIGAFVEAGGTFVTTYQSGVVDDSDLCHLGGFPGPLKGVLGVWAEETDVFWDIHTQSIRALDGDDLGLCGTYAVEDYADILHLEGAEALAEYAEDFYAGSPALTRNRCGDGEGYYIASRNDTRFLSDFYGGLAERIGLRRVLPVDLPEGVSAVERADEKNRFVFVMNFNPDGVEVPLGGGAYRNLLADGAGVKNAVRLDGYGVAVLQEA